MLAAITALKQICNHPAAYQDDGKPLAGRSGKLARLEEIVESVFEAGSGSWCSPTCRVGQEAGRPPHRVTGVPISCYHGGLACGARDQLIKDFQEGRAQARWCSPSRPAAPA